jgi:hypothetical protein
MISAASVDSAHDVSADYGPLQGPLVTQNLAFPEIGRTSVLDLNRLF